MQAVAFDVADHFAVEVDLVEVAAAVVEAVEASAVGQDGADAVAVAVVAVADGFEPVQPDQIVRGVLPVGGGLDGVGFAVAAGPLAGRLAGGVVVEGGGVLGCGGADQPPFFVVVVGGFLDAAPVVVDGVVD